MKRGGGRQSTAQGLGIRYRMFARIRDNLDEPVS